MSTFVYFVQAQDSGRIKIGFSKNPLKRLADLQVSSPEPLALLGVIEGTASLEQRLHHIHAEHRLHGEWFRPGASLVADIRARLGIDQPSPAQKASLDKAAAITTASTPTDLSAVGRINAHISWANTANRSARTAPARAAMEAKFLAEANGDPVRAAHLRKAHFQRLALKSAQARRRKKESA